MAEKTSPIEFSSFTGGLVTDASPLTYDPNTAIDISNFTLNTDGSLNRRLGLTQYEPTNLVGNQVPSTSTTSYEDYIEKSQGINVFTWKGLGLSRNITIFIVNLNGVTKTYRATPEGLVDITSNMFVPYGSARVNFAEATQVGKYMVTVPNGLNVSIFEYLEDTDEVAQVMSAPLQVRDIWGLPDWTGAPDFDPLTWDEYVNVRPLYTAAGTYSFYDHVYNLRNQGWNRAMLGPDTDVTYDMIDRFIVHSDDVGAERRFPSLADNPNSFIYPNTNTTAVSKTADRFHATDSFTSPPGSSRAPMGSYIIDLTGRHFSRWLNLERSYAQPNDTGWLLDTSLSSITDEDAVSGEVPSAIAWYAGRAWYAGFQGGVDSPVTWEEYPRLESALLFSQQGSSPNTFTKCYQVQDPTSKDSPDILDTDGGYIEVQGMSGVGKLLPYRSGLLIFATTGIWFVSGDGGPFTATNYSVRKITDVGVTNFKAIVSDGTTITYLDRLGLNVIGENAEGQIGTTLVSKGKLDKYFRSLSQDKLVTAKGVYVGPTSEFKWYMFDKEGSEVLIFNSVLKSYYVHKIDGDFYDGTTPAIISSVAMPRQLRGDFATGVTVGGDTVEALGQGVTVSEGYTGNSSVDEYLLIGKKRLGASQIGAVGFATYSDSSFTDYRDFDDAHTSWGGNVEEQDASAYLVTGHLTGGTTQKDKVVPYLTTTFKKTETGFEDSAGDLVPINPSSCKIQAQWEWTDSAISGRWSREFQAYRHRRFYMPSGSGDGYDDGHTVVTTKNKIRGKGKAVSLKMSTEPEKDCHILGWSMQVGVS